MDSNPQTGFPAPDFESLGRCFRTVHCRPKSYTLSTSDDGLNPLMSPTARHCPALLQLATLDAGAIAVDR